MKGIVEKRLAWVLIYLVLPMLLLTVLLTMLPMLLPTVEAAPYQAVQIRTVQLDCVQLDRTATLCDIGDFDYQARAQTWLQESGDMLGIEQMHNLADHLTVILRQSGYPLHRIIVPPQQIENSTLQLRLIPATIGQVDVRDNQRYSSRRIEATFSGQRLIETDAIEHSLALLKMYPGLEVFAYYSRGGVAGEANINVSVLQEKTFDAWLAVDNFGTQTTGKSRLSTQFAWNSPTGSGDRIALSLLQTAEPDNTTYGALAYELPWGDPSRLLDVTVARSQYDIGQNFSELKISGKANFGELGYRYTGDARDSSRWSLRLHGQHATTDLSSVLAPTLFDQHETVQDWGVSADKRWFNVVRGSQIAVQAGLRSVRWDIDDKRQPRYLLGELSLSAQKRWAAYDRWLYSITTFDISGQFASKMVASVDKRGLTGASALRSARPGYFSADRMALARLQWQWQYPDWLGRHAFSRHVKPLLFYDAVYGEQFSIETGDTVAARIILYSYGVGLRWHARDWSARLDWAELDHGTFDDFPQPQDSEWLSAQLQYHW